MNNTLIDLWPVWRGTDFFKCVFQLAQGRLQCTGCFPLWCRSAERWDGKKLVARTGNTPTLRSWFTPAGTKSAGTCDSSPMAPVPPTGACFCAGLRNRVFGPKNGVRSPRCIARTRHFSPRLSGTIVGGVRRQVIGSCRLHTVGLGLCRDRTRQHVQGSGQVLQPNMGIPADGQQRVAVPGQLLAGLHRCPARNQQAYEAMP
jgi:hypothetical protein